MMIRKQIYLPEDLERRLSVASQQQKKPEAELVREALEEKLGTGSPVSAGDALLRLAELGKRLDIRLRHEWLRPRRHPTRQGHADLR